MAAKKVLTERVAFYLTKKEVVALRAAAQRDCRSVSSMARKLISDGVKEQQRGR